MANWTKPEIAVYKIYPPSRRENDRVIVFPEFQVKVSRTEDIEQKEYPMVVLENLPINENSVLELPTRDQSIQAIFSGMKKTNPEMKPQDVNWFMLDTAGEIGDAGKLYAVELWSEKVTIKNQQYEALLRAGELSLKEEKDDKKYFPDEKVDELRTKINPIDPDRQRAVSHAFAGTTPDPDNEPER